MVHVVLWFNLISFALLFAGLWAEFLAWLRNRERFRAIYLWYIGVYAAFLLLHTFTYFNREYLKQPIAGLDPAFGYFRSAISVVLIAIISLYTARTAGFRLGKAGTVLVFLPAAVVLAGIVSVYAGAPAVISIALNVSFNSFIAIVSFLALLRVIRGKTDSPRSEVLPFLALSSSFYSFFAALGILIAARVIELRGPLISVGSNGLFCFAWGFLLLFSALRRSRPAKGVIGNLDPRFLSDFPFSPREVEVIGLLVQGITNKELGDRLFISSRTVETHTYNIYRKCGCRSKVELINKVRSYDAVPK